VSSVLRDWSNRSSLCRGPAAASYSTRCGGRFVHSGAPKTRNQDEYLAGVFQQESIHEFLQRTRLNRARRWSWDDLAIKEISARLNFSSELYFSRSFRKKPA
jgi:hypothetical protein